ncbi:MULTISPECIES: hypothetical protein [unclassified Thioalkalivibrio]|uniref:hypothetical protein n=1 Tax=unclassified Thioalkalivibrio TaxID=2621013 RepID=UPI0012DE87AF|nr:MULTISPECIES: hypothetical protein [unclassified Thioalkalivibrio]
MKSIEEIKDQFPTLSEVLGETYIEKLKSEQGALARRATINPFFKILFINDKDDIEGLFSQAIEKKAISLERLKRFRDERNNVNIQNFLNEFMVLKPMMDSGNFLDESNNNTTPDFLGVINNEEIVFECVSVNESQDSQKQRNLDTLETQRQFQKWKKKNPNGGVFSTFHENTPFDTTDLDKIIEKIKSKKSSRQVKGYKYKVMIMSFHTMSFLMQPKECLPNTSNRYDGIHSGILYHSFYGKHDDLLFESNLFDGGRHKIRRVKSDGRFIRDSDYNLCILHFATNENEEHKKYVFFENLKKPLPVGSRLVVYTFTK